MAATTALREALNQGISSGNLADTKIILYSHRDSSGRVCRPKALYANRHVLKTVPYFNNLLFRNSTKVRLKDFSEDVIDHEESAQDYGYSSDSDLEDDEDEKVTSFKQKAKSKGHPLNPFAIPGEDERIFCEDYEEHIEQGEVLRIPDVAFVTFQAFLMYLYTGVIEFAPFGSKENRRSRSAEIVTLSDDKIPRPSPKSIYRLADKYGVPALKTLALNHIRTGLKNCDIVEESFSKFTSRYIEIRRLCINRLDSAWMDDSTAEITRASVDKKIEGDLRHAAEILSALWEIANKDNDTKIPLNASPVVEDMRGKKKKKKKGGNITSTAHPMRMPSAEVAKEDGDIKAPSDISLPVTSPAHWATVKIALIKSIRNGVFFDRKYWARHSKTDDLLKPVYFSSTIIGDKSQQLNGLVKYIKGGSVLVNDLEGDVNVESDCEGCSMGICGGKSKEEKEESHAVLIKGSFSAWKSIFFYRCTDVILFAPLKSQDVDSRLHYIRTKTVATAPPPCSPKNIYILAGLLEMKSLRDRTLADIKDKVSQDNVVDEVFSRVAAGQDKIMEMQCELLVSKFNNPKTIALVQEKIGNMSDGSSPHCAGALKLGLKKAFGLKKQKRQPSGVLLRCTYSSCAWYNDQISYSSVGSNTYCPHCNYGYYLQCVGCGHNRTSNYPSCQGCGKRFI